MVACISCAISAARGVWQTSLLRLSAGSARQDTKPLLHAPDDARYGRVRHLQKALDLLLRRLTAAAVQIAEHAALRQRQVMLRKVGVGLYFDLVR